MPETLSKEYQSAYLTPTTDTSDEVLIKIAAGWQIESKKYHDQLSKIWTENERYYKGIQTMMEKVPSDLSNAVQNHIFMGVETVVPIMTANPPQFLAEPPEESDVSTDYSETLQKILSIQYETLDIRTRGEMMMRHMLIYRLGVLKISWDETTNNIGLKSVRPQRLYFPKVATELPYIMEHVDITADEFLEVFGEAKLQKFMGHIGQEIDPNDLDWAKKIQGIWTIWEIHTKKMVFWKYGSMIIDKRSNPTYDFKDKNNNHFVEPKIPYLIASVFKLGNEPIGETDLIQQCIPIQDVINVSNRLIINTSTKMGNAQWRVDSSVMSEEEANTKLTNSPGLIIYGEGVANENLMRRDPPPPLPSYITEIKLMAERAFDNIFGTHSTTRGERGAPETLGGRMLLKQADYGRIDLMVREYERVVSELGNWIAQLLKMNLGDGKRTFRYYGETGVKFVELTAQMIEKGVKIMVKSGTTLPKDEMSKSREAIDLWGMNAIAPQTLYERLKFPDPEGEAQKLAAWQKEKKILEEEAIAEVQGRQARPLPSGQKEVADAAAKITGGQ